MFNLPSDSPDMQCPDCHRVMVELRKYGYAVENDSAGVSGDVGYMGNPFSGAGRTLLILEVFGHLFNFVFGGIMASMHRRKVRKLVQEVLPAFPKSMICPACLFVYRTRG